MTASVHKDVRVSFLACAARNMKLLYKLIHKQSSSQRTEIASAAANFLQRVKFIKSVLHSLCVRCGVSKLLATRRGQGVVFIFVAFNFITLRVVYGRESFRTHLPLARTHKEFNTDFIKLNATKIKTTP